MFLPIALLTASAASTPAQFFGGPKKTPPPPPAPIPSGIAVAKTVFLANLCEQYYPSCAPIYNELYERISKQGKYQLVNSPAAADLVFEIRYSNEMNSVSGFRGAVTSSNQTILRLKIVDRATQIPLWMVTEPESDKTSSVDSMMLDLDVLSRPGQTAGPMVKFPPKK